MSETTNAEERRDAYRRGEGNGWNEAKALVMHELGAFGADVKDLRKGLGELRKAVETKLQTLEEKIDKKISRFHVAPCKEISEISKDSGKQASRIAALEEGQKEMTRGIRWMIGIGLTIIGLLAGVLYQGG